MVHARLYISRSWGARPLIPTHRHRYCSKQLRSNDHPVANDLRFVFFRASNKTQILLGALVLTEGQSRVMRVLQCAVRFPRFRIGPQIESVLSCIEVLSTQVPPPYGPEKFYSEFIPLSFEGFAPLRGNGHRTLIGAAMPRWLGQAADDQLIKRRSWNPEMHIQLTKACCWNARKKATGNTIKESE